MHHTLTASLPQHYYGWVDSRFTHGMDESYKGELEECVILAITSRPSRALHFEIMTKSGAKWANAPLHLVYWEKPTAPAHKLSDLQCWDCHGWNFALFSIEYLREMQCDYLTPSRELIPARYGFTLDHTDNGFSLYPPEHKNYNILFLEDGSGQIAAMPNNRIFYKDNSFVKRPKEFDYKVVNTAIYHAEDIDINPQDSAITKENV